MDPPGGAFFQLVWVVLPLTLGAAIRILLQLADERKQQRARQKRALHQTDRQVVDAAPARVTA